MDKIFRIGANTLVIENGKILLGRRLNVTGHGTWGMPGGHVEFGERFDEAARRELEEETGLIADSMQFLQLINEPREDTHYLHVNFLITKWHGQLENKEPNKCAELKWFDLNNLPKDFFFGHAPFVPAYLANQVYVEAHVESGDQKIIPHE